MNTTLTTDQAVTLAMVLGLLIGAIIALVSSKSAVKSYKAAQAKKWGDLINMAMSNAYSAGYADAKSEGKKRPSGNIK